jgi:vacuolar-type H+-ATPase subunit B/Vma2
MEKSAPLSSETPAFVPVPTVLVVGGDAVLEQWCALTAPALRVVRAAHARAAIERIAVTRPMVVVVAGDVAATDAERVREIASAAGAEVVERAGKGPAELEVHLVAAVERASRRIEAG